MYGQKREFMERIPKQDNAFPGLMQKIKQEPIVEEKKLLGKQKSSAATPSVDSGAGQKKIGRPKKTVI